MTLKPFLKNINVLNLLLLCAILLFSQYVLLPLFNIKITVPSLPAKAVVAPPPGAGAAADGESGETGTGARATPPLMEFTVIAEQNLFHPDRKIPPLKQAEKAVPRPEFVLYGTLITDNVSLAYLADKKAPRTTPGRGQRQTALKVGDSLSGYTLKEIQHQKVVMSRGEDRMEVKVVSSDKTKGRSAGETTAAGAEGAGPNIGDGGAPQPMTPQPPVNRPVPPRPQPQSPGGKKPSTWRF